MRSEKGAAKAMEFREGNEMYELALKIAVERSLDTCACKTCLRCGGSMEGLVATGVETALWIASGNDPERLGDLD